MTTKQVENGPAAQVPPERPPTTRSHTDDVASVTYSYLRWMMTALPLLLLAVMLWTAIWVQGGVFEGSISAYYGGPVRDVFVGVLIAVAACLVMYRGVTPLEDYALNGAGFYAVFVALVPTGLGEILENGEVLENADVVTAEGVTAAEYVGFLRAALTTVVALCVFLVVYEWRKSRRLRDLLEKGQQSAGFVAVTMGVLLSFVVLAMWQLWVPAAADVRMSGFSIAGVQLRIHDLAAILLICSLSVAVWSYIWPRAEGSSGTGGVDRPDPTWRRRYVVVLLLMLPGALVVAAGCAWLAPDHLIIWLEWWEILLFSAFWFMETLRIKAVKTRTG